MTKIESKIIDVIRNNVVVIFLCAVTFCGIVMRIFGLKFQSGDFQSFLNPWWQQISAGGLQGIAHQVGNYNIPYQIITYLLTFLPYGALYSYKLLSIIFDFFLALAAALCVLSFCKSNKKIKASLTYAIVFCLITVVLNSAFWAQCDSIYVTFILFSIYFLQKDKSIPSFIFLGIAFAFKLQTVFILPVYLYYYFTTRKFSILNFFFIPLVDFVMCLPAVLLGRPLSDILTIYLEQTDYGKLLQFNCPNLYAIICDGANTYYYTYLKNFSIFLTFAILGAGLVMVIYRRVNMKNTENFLLSAIWTVFTCIMFLSSMHERYGYLLDILAIIYAITMCKKIWLPIACTLVSLRGYSFYLFGYEVLDLRTTAVIYFTVYVIFTYQFFRDVIKNGEKLPEDYGKVTDTAGSAIGESLASEPSGAVTDSSNAGYTQEGEIIPENTLEQADIENTRSEDTPEQADIENAYSEDTLVQADIENTRSDDMPEH